MNTRHIASEAHPEIEHFLSRLAAFAHSDTVFNPYQDEALVNNLRLYLNLFLDDTSHRVLLVGEAPGYLGCRVTGIPFTCSKQLANTSHPRLKPIKPNLRLSSIETENTANFMWSVLQRKRKIPLFWNAFPFHPHKKDLPCSNRGPNAQEITLGADFLEALVHIFLPSKLAGIGRAGEQALRSCFPEKKIRYIRHPSYGGKTDFLAGMKKLL